MGGTLQDMRDLYHAAQRGRWATDRASGLEQEHSAALTKVLESARVNGRIPRVIFTDVVAPGWYREASQGRFTYVDGSRTAGGPGDVLVLPPNGPETPTQWMELRHAGPEQWADLRQARFKLGPNEPWTEHPAKPSQPSPDQRDVSRRGLLSRMLSRGV